MKRYEREVFARVPMLSTYSAYTDKHDYPRREIVYSAMPDKLLRAAFMLTWKAGASWKYDRNTAIQHALKAVEITRELHPAARIKKPTANQAEKLEFLGMLVDRIYNAGDFKSLHQYRALRAIILVQKTGDITRLHAVGVNLYAWAGETC